MKKTLIVLLSLSFGLLFSQNRTSAINKTLELEKKDSLHQEADELPVYPGGINAFRKNFTKTFNSSKINANGLAKSEVRFVISEDGIITEIEAIGLNRSMNKEMERTIKSLSKTKWKPAMLNGKPVRYMFRLPITMNFHN